MIVEEKKLSSFLICYASQKGTAQSIAEEISEQCTQHSLKSSCQLSCISEITNLKQLIKFSCIIFVGSTTGEGDPPDTAQQFMRELQKQERGATSLSWLHYTILGLGDTNYTNFCNFGKTLDNCLQKVKAQRFYECGWADDGVGLEIVVEPWLEGLFPALKEFLDSAQDRKGSILDFIDSKEPNPYDNDPITIVDSAGSLKEMKTESDLGETQSRPRDLSPVFPSLCLPSIDEITTNPVKKCMFDAEENLTLPALPSSFIKIDFLGSDFDRSRWDEVVLHNVAPYPLARSEIIPCQIAGHRQLTKESAVKKALEISLESVSESNFEYEPGDSFGIVVENRSDEVNLLLCLLQVEDKADLELALSIDRSTQKRAAQIPKFIPSGCSLRYIFTHCLDIRAAPKKLLVRSLIEYTRDEVEKRRLSELVSKEGASEYNRVFRTEGLTLLDLLVLFSTCVPPPSLLLEHLPRLLPRPYSATSSPLVSPKRLSFVFNVVGVAQGPGAVFGRKGLCTGWLDEVTKMLDPVKKPSRKDSLSQELENLRLDPGNEKSVCEIQIYFRSNQTFRLPKNIETPFIMIGPGTGVAPFVGFLEHRRAQMMLPEVQSTNQIQNSSAQDSEKSSELQTCSNNASMNPLFSWLFFGCRHKDKDFLYREELELMVQNKVLMQLSPSFSRDERGDSNEPRYVQDSLLLHGKEVVEWVHDKEAFVYVCGDARNMARNVQDTFVLMFQSHLEMSEQDARRFLAQMQMSQRYLQDVWA